MSEATIRRGRVGADLTQGPIFNSLIKFAIPMVLANVIQQLYSMVDLIVIGQYMGSIGTVGVSTGGEMSDMMLPLATAFAAGGQIYIAQLVGAGRRDKMKEAIGTFISMMAIMAVAIMAVLIIFCRPLLNLINCPGEAMTQATAYMIITAIGLPFVFGYNAICSILRGMGESKRPLIFIIVAAVSNIFLDLLLVAVFKWEAAGTAIATVIAEAASFIASLIYMIERKEDMGLEFSLSAFKIKWEPCKVILALGIPQAARSFLVRTSLLWVNSNINSYGLTVAATNSVGNKLQKFLDVYSQAMSHAASAMVGQNLGAKKHDRATKTVMYTLYVSLAIAAVSILLALCIPHQLYRLFTNDPAVIAMGKEYLQIMIWMFLLSAIVNSYQAMVTGCGAATLNFAIGILDGVICKIGLSLIFSKVFGMGYQSFFWGISLSRFIPAIICIVFFYRGTWKNMTLVEGIGRRH